MTQAKNGDSVSIHYTGKLSDGTIFDSSEGKEPLSFTLGSGQVIPGFEDAVLGMTAGDSQTVTIPKENAYGEYDEQKVINFPVDRIPPNVKPEVGMPIQLKSEDGQEVVVRITEVTEEHVILDGNAPLAGQDLTFDIELVSINA